MRLIDADKLQDEYKKSHDGKRLLLIDAAPTVDIQADLDQAYRTGYNRGYDAKTREVGDVCLSDWDFL